jgi:large subunit ribosomal protein L21e
MPHSYGYRARTRDMFARPFRKSGMIKLSTYMTTYKRGDYVDIKCNPAQHKGMPFKHYHGRTGIVYNVTPRAVGIRVNKELNGKILEKRINVRVEHVIPSKCRIGHIARVKENEAKKTAARKGGEKTNLKRQPILPKAGYKVKLPEPETMQPIPFSALL